VTPSVAAPGDTHPSDATGVDFGLLMKIWMGITSWKWKWQCTYVKL